MFTPLDFYWMFICCTTENTDVHNVMLQHWSLQETANVVHNSVNILKRSSVGSDFNATET